MPLSLRLLQSEFQSVVAGDVAAYCWPHTRIGLELYMGVQEGEHVVLVLEHCGAGDLHGILSKHGGRISERMCVRKVLAPLLTALQVCAGLGCACLHQEYMCMESQHVMAMLLSAAVNDRHGYSCQRPTW